MSLKQEIETWVAALAAYDSNEFDSALRCFEQIADTSKILFNVGVINATLGEHARAVEFYQRAVRLDQYLAVAYFQQGVSNFLMGDFEEALANFNDTLLYLRGNNKIDYEQLGLKFKLYSCEALFNRGLCYVYLQQKDAGMQDLHFAAKEKVVPDHDVIDEAIKEQAEGYTVFSIPVGIVYRPNEAKVKNLKTKDYLGKARLVAAQDQQNTDPRRQAALAAMGLDDRPQDKLSYAALNLVKPDLRSRSGRLQSEPPLNRNIFPPTPPPEPERPDSRSGFNKRSLADSPTSSTSGLQQARPAAKPLRLDLGVAAFEQSQQKFDRPRLGTKRSESERPPMRREHSGHSTRSYDDRRRTERPMQQQDFPEVRVEDDVIVAYSPEVIQQQRQQRQQQRQQQHDPAQSPQPRPSHHHRSHSSVHATKPQPVPISEEDEEGDETSDVVSDAALSPLAFEIVPPHHKHHRHRSHSRRTAPPPELRKIRVKVHAEDMRYVMTTPGAAYAELVAQVRAKFALAGAFKLKIRDEEGDSITMADQEDWEMAVGMCRVVAAKERSEMGKMEVWVQEI